MIYPNADGTFCISSGEIWLAGVYESKRAARYAFRFPDEVLARLQRQLNETQEDPNTEDAGMTRPSDQEIQAKADKVAPYTGGYYQTVRWMNDGFVQGATWARGEMDKDLALLAELRAARKSYETRCEHGAFSRDETRKALEELNRLRNLVELGE